MSLNLSWAAFLKLSGSLSLLAKACPVHLERRELKYIDRPQTNIADT
jgi:hypothetical protein